MYVLTLFLSGFWHDRNKRLLSREFSPSSTSWQKLQEEQRDRAGLRVGVTSSCRDSEGFYTAAGHQSRWRLPSSAQGCWNLTDSSGTFLPSVVCALLPRLLEGISCPSRVADASTSNFLNSAAASCSLLFFSVQPTDACADSAAHGVFWVIK